MKKATLLLLSILALLGISNVQAGEVVNGYTADFNTQFSTTSDHAFSVDKDWKHIVDYYEDDGTYFYMSYSYYASSGVNGSGTLLAYRQYASGSGYGASGKVVHDMLVTPKVSGKVTIQVKGSTSASNSYPSFIQFYKVNEKGTEYGEQITAVTYTDAERQPAEINTSEFVTAEIEVDEATRIGIRAQYVYMDDFTAETAELEKEKKLSITSAVPSATNGTIYWDQQENGNVLVKYTVKVKNNGETSFAVDDDDYSVSIFNRKTKEVYVTVNVPEALGPGETSGEFDVAVEIPSSTWPNTYTYINMDLKENISGTVVQRAQSQYNAYEPKFVFREGGSSSTSNMYGDIAFGKITDETTKTYEIYNDGVAPLQVKSITVPEGFIVNNSGNFTLASKANQPFTITLPVTTVGIFSGNLEIVYVDKTGADVTYTKAVSGTVLDPTKNIITFDDGNGNAFYPQGSVRYNAYISSEGSGSSKNYYLQGSTPNPLFITPLMTATKDESFTFDALNTTSGGKVEVMISTDRQNWTTIQTINSIASSYIWTTYTATIPDAGDYYIGFKVTSAKIDNIYGLVYSANAPAHDLLLVNSDIPATGKQNNDYTATAAIGNVGPNVETAGSYTATLYVDGEAVATSNDVDLPVAVISGNYNNAEEQNYTKLSFTFRPHFTGEKDVYIEVTSGDAVLKTGVVNVNFAEEKVESDAAIGGSTASNTSLLHLNWNNSESVTLYTADMLAAAGLEAGDVIESITYKGYCSNSSDYDTELSVWYEQTDDTKQSTPAIGKYDTSGMTQVLSETHTWTKVGSSTEWVDLITINLATPIVYEEGKALRFVVCSEGTTYKNGTSFEITNTSGADKSYYNRNDTRSTFENTQSWSQNTYVPAIHFGLKAEPKTFSGVVTEEDGETPVAGATVTIRNDVNDVEYFATTDETGAYTINVVQNTLPYTATVTADGYETLVDEEELVFKVESQTKNFTLVKLPAVVVNIGQTGYATFYYSNSAYLIPKGVEAKAVESINGKTITLIPVSDIIPAGCAVILEGEQGEYTFVQTSEEGTAVENMLRGTDEKEMITPEEQECKYYKLSVKNNVVGFYFGADYGAIFENEAHKAYLAVPVLQSNGVNCFTFDNSTGIDNIRVNEEAGRTYNLSGQRVNDSYKGVVIVNGKKVLKR